MKGMSKDLELAARFPNAGWGVRRMMKWNITSFKTAALRKKEEREKNNRRKAKDGTIPTKLAPFGRYKTKEGGIKVE